MSAPATEQPKPAVAVPAAVGVVLAAVVAVLAIVGLVVSITTDELPSGPAMAPPPPPTPEVSYDSLVRRARFAEVSVSMPGKPYVCPNAPGEAPPVLASGLVCNAPVHAEYNGTDDWSATAAFGSVSDDLSRSTAEETAQAVFEQLRAVSFANEETTLSDQATEQVDLDGHPVTVTRGNVHYQVTGVPSRNDRMVVIILPLEAGGYAVYFTSRPDDTPEATLDRLNGSVGTLRYER